MARAARTGRTMAGSATRDLARDLMLRVQLAVETDVVLARQRAKQIAALVGFELQDQTRVATAVSEIARNAWEYGRGGVVEFFFDAVSEASGEDRPGLRIVVTDQGPGIAELQTILRGAYVSQTGMGLGITGTRRLMDGMEIASSTAGTSVTIRKQLPRQAQVPTMAKLSAEVSRIAGQGMEPGRALHDQNHELLTLLNELRARETELETLNVELEETNRGVLVLYAELADKAQAVQQASEMKTRFLSGVTHELRTPLNSIVSLARLMLHHTDGPLNAEQEKQVQFMLRSAQSLTEMVNDLLDLAKIEAGKSTPVLSQFTVQEFFTGLRGMFRPLATNPQVKLTIELPEQALPLYTDEGKLAQILRNFISNALKFTEEGTVRVTATPLEGSEIRFAVADTGVGIAPEHHGLVMQEWGQAPASGAAGRPKGSGLGLPLSRSLAELLGGSVGFTSAAGEGSTFFVTLPALAAPVPASPGHGEARAGSILIVDDDEVSRYLLRRQLGTLTTSEIEEAASGAEALQRIAERVPRLIFLDLLMPGTNGFELGRELRLRPETAGVRLVVHTSKPLSDAEVRTLEELDATVILKRSNAGDTLESIDAQRAQLERALLETGLSNLHVEAAS